MTAAVALHDLRFHYATGSFRLSIDALEVPPGEKTVVIGPSGSGKTTLLHLIAGILTPDAGRVEVDGTEVSALPDGRRRELRIARLGMIFQEFELLEHLTVRENILLPYHIHGALRRDLEVDAHLAVLTERTGIARYLDRKPRDLSQGERQRVAIGRALIARPRVILADEPTGNLDPDTTLEVLDSMFEEVAASGATLVMVTHDHTLLERFDRTIDFGDLWERAS